MQAYFDFATSYLCKRFLLHTEKVNDIKQMPQEEEEEEKNEWIKACILATYFFNIEKSKIIGGAILDRKEKIFSSFHYPFLNEIEMICQVLLPFFLYENQRSGEFDKTTNEQEEFIPIKQSTPINLNQFSFKNNTYTLLHMIKNKTSSFSQPSIYIYKEKKTLNSSTVANQKIEKYHNNQEHLEENYIENYIYFLLLFQDQIIHHILILEYQEIVSAPLFSWTEISQQQQKQQQQQQQPFLIYPQLKKNNNVPKEGLLFPYLIQIHHHLCYSSFQDDSSSSEKPNKLEFYGKNYECVFCNHEKKKEVHPFNFNLNLCTFPLFNWNLEYVSSSLNYEKLAKGFINNYKKILQEKKDKKKNYFYFKAMTIKNSFWKDKIHLLNC